MMSVFTFMGANIMRQDDAYSFLIIGKILETVVPALIMVRAYSFIINIFIPLPKKIVCLFFVFFGGYIGITLENWSICLVKLTRP